MYELITVVTAHSNPLQAQARANPSTKRADGPEVPLLLEAICH